VPRPASRDGTWYEAAVTLILRETDDGALELLFIERAARDGDPWSGQVAFPGGRRDASDASLEKTAVRETLEEVGIDLRRDGTMLGALDELRPSTPTLPPVIVRPFVATVRAEARVASVGEVASFFWAPLDLVLDPAFTTQREISIRGMRTVRPAIEFEGHVIWGMTERILKGFAEVVR
jgi:8-oxo-dGTP pyrophosphatase MutT (NUDIX family)